MSLDEVLFAWVWRMTRALRRNAAPAGECPRGTTSGAVPTPDAGGAGAERGRWRFRTPSRLVALSRRCSTCSTSALPPRWQRTSTPICIGVAYGHLTPAWPDPGCRRLSGAGFSGLCTLLCPGNAACLRNDLANDSLLTAAIISPAPGRSPALAGLETTTACLEALTQALLGRPLPTSAATPGWTWLRQSLTVSSEGWSGAQAQTLWTALQHCCVRRTSALACLL